MGSAPASLPFVTRRPGLDALRAGATLLVVLLHAAVPYTVAPMPGLAWPVNHAVVSPVVDAIFWGIEGAIMPLFFLLSGYGAAQSLAGKPNQFLASRWRRIGWPLLGAACVLLPLELYVWLTGWALDGQLEWKKLQSLKLGPYHDGLWGLSHLWYMEYLLILSALLWAGFKAADGIRGFSSFRGNHPRLWALFPLTAAVLWLAPETVVGFQHSFVPVPAKFVYSGLFFAAGVVQFHHPLRMRLDRPWIFAACGVLQLALLPLIHRQASQPLVGIEKLLLVLGMTTFAVVLTHAVWQTAWHSAAEISPRVRAIAQASFWIYLVHHPLVAVWQIILRPTGWPADVQFTLCTLATLAMSLASYEWLVRRTLLGAFLEGRPSEKPAPRAEPAPQRRAA